MLWKRSDGGELSPKEKKVPQMNNRKQHGRDVDERPHQIRTQVGRAPGIGMSTSVDMVVTWKPKKQKQPSPGAESGSMTISNPLFIPNKGDWFRVNGTYKGKVVGRFISPHKFKPWVVSITLGRVVEIK